MSRRWRRALRHRAFGDRPRGLTVADRRDRASCPSSTRRAIPSAWSSRARLESPSTSHPMGTDQYGRDLLSRVMRGAIASLAVGRGGGRHRDEHRRGRWGRPADGSAAGSTRRRCGVTGRRLRVSGGPVGAPRRRRCSAQACSSAWSPWASRTSRSSRGSRGLTSFRSARRSSSRRREALGARDGAILWRPRPAQHGLAAHRAGDDLVPARDPGRGGAVVSRARNPAAPSVVGAHAAGGAELPPALAVVRGLSRARPSRSPSWASTSGGRARATSWIRGRADVAAPGGGQRFVGAGSRPCWKSAQVVLVDLGDACGQVHHPWRPIRPGKRPEPEPARLLAAHGVGHAARCGAGA
mgnify:CR=1 FL=1